MVLHPVFEYSIIVIILISSVHLAIDSPLLNPHGDFKKALIIIDVIITIIFSVEALLKIFAFGII